MNKPFICKKFKYSLALTAIAACAVQMSALAQPAYPSKPITQVAVLYTHLKMPTNRED